MQNPDGQPEGEIAGNDGGDVLVGDVGGGDLIGKTMNLALVLDTSDSMDAEINFNGASMTRIEALAQAIEQLLQNLADTEGATVRFHRVSLASGLTGTPTLDFLADNGGSSVRARVSSYGSTLVVPVPIK